MSEFQLVSTIESQPEFPVVDLTEQNADQLSLMLQNKQTVQNYHIGSKGALAFRRLHPAIEKGIAYTYTDDDKAEAMSHGMMLFEAINAAVTSVNPATISSEALYVVMRSPKTVERIIDPTHTQEVSRFFTEQLPRTAEVISSASERFFPTKVPYALAGAALECLITSQALRVEKTRLHP